jgi:hypothetical protein
MKHVMQHEATGIIGLSISWYMAFLNFLNFSLTIDKIHTWLPVILSGGASIMTFIYYFRKNKRENKKP